MHSHNKAGIFILVFLATFIRSTASTTIDFDKTLVGVVFTPLTISENTASEEDEVEHMLEVVSKKFHFIHPMGIGAFSGSAAENRKHTDRMIPLCAARLNKKHGKLIVRVNITIAQHGRTDKDGWEMKEAANAIKEANEIFNGTISSFKFKAYDNGDDILLPNLSKFLAKHFPWDLPFPIGVQLTECQDLADFITGLDENLQKTLHRLSYIVCEEFLLHKILRETADEKDPVQYIIDRVDEYNNVLKANNLSIATVISTGWPSKYLFDGNRMNSLYSMKSYWTRLNKFSKERKQPFILFTAFDSSDDHYGWWKRIDSDNNASSSGADVFYEVLDNSKRTEHSTTLRPILSTANGASSNELSFLYISGIYLGIALIQMVLACYRL